MMHNVSHQPLLLATFIVLFSSTFTAQVKIKERLEIKPKPPAQAVVSGESVMFTEDPNPGGLPHALVVHPCFITASATIEMHGAPSSDLYVKTSAGGAIAWYNGHGYSPPLHEDNPVTFRAGCGTVAIRLESTWEGSDIRSITKAITPSSAIFVINGMLSGTPYTVTAQLSAVSDNSGDLGTMVLTSDRTQLTQCQTDAGVHFEATDNTGGFYYGMTCSGRVYHKIAVQSSYDVYLEHQGNWLKEVEYDWGLRDSRVRWNYHGETEPSTATFTWQMGEQTKTTTFDLVVAPEEMKITFGKDEIGYGESTTVRVDAQNRDGTLSPIPAGWTVWFQMMEGSDKGFLYSLDSTQTGDWIVGTSPEVKFYAKTQAYPPGQILVPIVTWITKDDGGIYASAKILGKSDTLRTPNLLFKSLISGKGNSLAKASGSPLRLLSTNTTGAEPCEGIFVIDTLVVKEKSRLTGFVVKLSKDTLEERQTADLTVIAIDKDSGEVTFDAGIPMMLMFDDGGPFVDFVRGPGDTVETLINNIPYGTLRAGKVKIVAAKKAAPPPPNAAVTAQKPKQVARSATNTVRQEKRNEYPKSKIIAIQVADATKTGTKTAYFKPAVKVIAVQDSIKPFYPNPDHVSEYLIDTTESRTRVKVVVTVSGVLNYFVPPLQIELTSAAIDSSGGHSHSANRPTGYFGNSIRDTVKMLEFETTGDTLRTSYLASMFGGKERVVARLKGLTPTIADTDTMVVRVPGLFLVKDSAGIYEKTGGTNSHHGPRVDDKYPNARQPDDNHYLSSQEGIDSLVSAAKRFITMKWNTSGKMRLNDMSLKLGGMFDLDSNWTMPHESHRLGKSVDIENLDLVQIDTVDVNTGLATTLTIPKVRWITDFIDFVQNGTGGWRFEDEKQTLSDIYKRSKKYPHFEWRGK